MDVCRQGIQRKPALLRIFPEDLARAQVIVRDVGIFNDTLMHSLFEDLGQLKESDIVLVNWGAWYPRFTWGETEVSTAVVRQGHVCIGSETPCKGAKRPGLLNDEQSLLHCEHWKLGRPGTLGSMAGAHGSAVPGPPGARASQSHLGGRQATMM